MVANRFWCSTQPAIAPGTRPTTSRNSREQNASISQSFSYMYAQTLIHSLNLFYYHNNCYGASLTQI